MNKRTLLYCVIVFLISVFVSACSRVAIVKGNIRVETRYEVVTINKGTLGDNPYYSMGIRTCETCQIEAIEIRRELYDTCNVGDVYIELEAYGKHTSYCEDSE